ncbi:MAG: nitroreductase family protein [Spirochaetaceae bacterium]|nr:nitroreductase family protein [Spirochaetaceae bacterium]
MELNETLRTIFARKSVRHYAEGALPRASLELLVKAGMAAPSAVDQRPWEFVIVTDPAMLQSLGAALPYARMTASAPAAIVVCGDLRRQWGGPDSPIWIMDCSAAIENILLAAESLGLGAVWTAVYPYPEKVAPVRSLLELPEYIEPLAVLPVGVPAGREKAKDKYDPTKVHWEKWQ